MKGRGECIGKGGCEGETLVGASGGGRGCDGSVHNIIFHSHAVLILTKTVETSII